MLQPRISALLTPGKVRPNIETLRRIAEAFDCGLQVRFVPFRKLAYWSESFNPEHFSIPTFDEEIKQSEKREDAAVAVPIVPAKSTYTTIEMSSAMFGAEQTEPKFFEGPGVTLGDLSWRIGSRQNVETDIRKIRKAA